MYSYSSLSQIVQSITEEGFKLGTLIYTNM